MKKDKSIVYNGNMRQNGRIMGFFFRGLKKYSLHLRLVGHEAPRSTQTEKGMGKIKKNYQQKIISAITLHTLTHAQRAFYAYISYITLYNRGPLISCAREAYNCWVVRLSIE